ncbi:MAG: AAA family ATPase [Ktedonobacteraceae bacterium]
MNGSNKITYHQQISYCGKSRCRRCREGIGHGPYWYAYQTVDGHTTRTYIGKHLPAEAQATVDGMHPIQELSVPASSEYEQIRIYTLGQFRLERRTNSEWQTVTDAAWQQQRVRVLLSCLVSTTNRKLGREQLTATLWPDILDSETASSRLDRAVHSLRQVFEPTRGKLAASPFLLTEREMLVLADQQHIWIDADAFEHFITLAHATDNPTEKERLLEEASTLYSGDFLPEERKSEVTLARRTNLSHSLAGLLIELAELRINREALTGAIEPLNQLLSIDPANEAAVQILMRVLAQLGRRGEALRAYKRLITVLQQEYQIAPLPTTRSLYEAVRAIPTRNRDVGTDVSRPLPQTPSSPDTANLSSPRRYGHLPQGRDTSVPTDNLSNEERNKPAPQIGRTHQSPLVGRTQELKDLLTLLGTTEQAAKFKLPGQRKHATSLALDTQRTPQCMILMGEVGIGKTRLAEEIGREARARGWLVAWSRVYAQEGGIPYRLWIEVLRKALTNGMVQRQEIAKRPLVYQPLNALLPELHTLLPHVEFPTQMLAEQEQLRLWEAARELLSNVAEGTPLLIVLDDLQWSDGSSCELLAYLARRIYGHPIIIVGTCRDNELPANHALRPLLTDLQRERVVETIALEPLSDQQIGTLVTQIAQPTMQLAEPTIERIQDRAAGNPFFAEELTRGMSLQSEPLPESITAVLDLRLDRLSKACQILLRKAAVLGGSFEFPLIQAMEATSASGDVDEDAILDLLEEALKSGMLTEEGVGTRITYLFWHPLLVSHLYEGLSAARRASLHRRAADILRTTYQRHEEEGAAIITHHLLLGGGDPQHIIHYAELAGDRAYGLSAYPEAEKHYLIVVEYIDSTTGKDADVEEQMRLAYVLELLGECTFVQGKTEDARHFYERVLQIRSKQAISILSDTMQQEAQIQALLWCEIGWTWYVTGNIEKTRYYYEHGEKVLRDAGVVGGPAWAKFYLQKSYINRQEGRYEDAKHNAYEGLKLLEGFTTNEKLTNNRIHRLTQVRRTLLGDPVDLGRTHTLLGTLAIAMGQFATAITHLNTALALYEQYQRQREIASVCCNLGDVYLRKAEYILVQSTLRRSLSIAEQIGDIPLICVIRVNLGLLAMRLGGLVEAENEFKRSIELAEYINDPVYTSIFRSYLSVALQEQGKELEARTNIYQSLRTAKSMHIVPCIGLALIGLGSMYTTQALAIEDELKKIQVLKRAKTILHRGLMLEAIEAETKTECKLLLAQIAFLFGEIKSAEQQALQTLKEAKQYELTWLVARTQRVLGSIMTALQEDEQAKQYFEQALRTFQKRGMVIEEARTIREQSAALLSYVDLSVEERDKARQDLYAVNETFATRQAVLDVQITQCILATRILHVHV